LTGPFVLDASMTLSWAFEGEATPFTVAVLRSLETVHAVVPALWAFEVASVLNMAERRGRMDAAAQAAFLERLRRLPIAVEQRPATWLAQQILPLARAYRLSAYDAAYLELAIREGLPLATLDDDLRRAAGAAGVPLVAGASPTART
jgi:predicted nucleic acid-binding protein